MTEKKILIIEDEIGVQITLKDRLVSEGYYVEIAGDGIEGEKLALKNDADIIILDVMLPGKDGFSICRDLRKVGNNTPILMLTARDTNIDTVMGLRQGADDYLAKPFDMQVLLARIDAILRRYESAGKNRSGFEDDIIKFGEFSLDLNSGILKCDDTQIDINAQEYKLLKYLVLNSDRIISRNKILDDVWGYESEISTRTVDVHIAKLRQRLGKSDKLGHIITYRGRGYKFILE